MRGSSQLQSVYATSPSTREEPFAILEINANKCVTRNYSGYYKDTSTATFSPSGDTVVGADFVSKYVQNFRPINDGDMESLNIQLRYVDEPDKYYTETFPIDSIFKPNRPGPGAVKLMAGAGLADQFNDTTKARFYTADMNHPYKYWRAHRVPETAFTNCHPFAVYDRSFWTNKIKITHQTYAGLPKLFSVQVLPHGSTTWTTVYTQASGFWPASGELKIYYNKDTGWTQTPSAESVESIDTEGIISNAVKIYGIRLLITEMGTGTAGSLVTNNAVPIEIIELSPRLSLDISEYVEGFKVEQNLSEEEGPLLIGEISANTGSITLNDIEGLFKPTNPSNIMYGLSVKGAVIDIYFKAWINDTTTEINRLFYGFIEDIPESNDNSSDAPIIDSMTILQEQKFTDFFMMNQRVDTIIRAITDLCGISNVQFNGSASQSIPYFYYRDVTAYDMLLDIAEAYQMAMSFDGNNVLQVFTAGNIVTKPVGTQDAIFTYSDYNGWLANIEEIEITKGKPVNDISITYSPHFMRKKPVQGDEDKPLWLAQQEEAYTDAWTPEEQLIGAAPLVRTLAYGEMVAYLDQEGAQYYDWTGYFQVNDEVVEYDAKEYHLNVGYGYMLVWIRSDEEFLQYQNMIIPGTRMYFTGRLRLIRRGAFKSIHRTHSVSMVSEYPYLGSNASELWKSWKISQYITTQIKNEANFDWRFATGTVYNLRGSFNFTPTGAGRNGSESAIRITGPTTTDMNNKATATVTGAQLIDNAAHFYLTWTKGSVIPKRIGAAIRFPGRFDGEAEVGPLLTHARGGVGIHMTSNSAGRLSGWVAEIQPSSVCPENNVKLWRIDNDVWTIKAQSTKNVTMFQYNDTQYTRSSGDPFYYLEIAYWPDNNGSPLYGVYLNGNWVTGFRPTTEPKDNSQAYGVFARSYSAVDVDYTTWTTVSDPARIQGWSITNENDPEDISVYDAIEGGGAGPSGWLDETTRWIYNKDFNSGGVIGLQEFGPITHEVRVFDVDYGDEPFVNPKLVIQPRSEFNVPYFDSNSFGGQMVVVNGRRRAVTFGSGSAVTGHKVEKDEGVVNIKTLADVENADLSASIARMNASKTVHGVIPFSMDSELIQTRQAAINMFNYVLHQHAINCDSIAMTIFGNPLIEFGDKVRIVYDEKGYGMSQCFVVTGVSNSWDDGLTTSIDLRRIP